MQQSILPTDLRQRASPDDLPRVEENFGIELVFDQIFGELFALMRVGD